jgi:hypothetical protein
MHQIKLSLLILTTIVATSLPARADDRSSTTTIIIAQATSTDIISVGASIINNLFNPPSRSAEIAADAEIKKAKIAAEAEITKEKMRIEASKSTDRVTPVLNQWGVAQVACTPGLVFINGITTETVCIQPTANISAGYYTYDSGKQQLIRNSSTSTQNVNSTNIQNVSSTSTQNVNGTNLKTIRTVQSIKVSSPATQTSRDRGF